MISKIDLCSKFQKQILAYNFCVDSKENKIIFSSSEGISKIDYNEANASKSCLSLIGNLDSVATIVECTSIEIIAVGYQNGTIGIYSKKYSQELLQISEFSSYPILTIQFLFIELKIKDSKKKVKYFDECKFVASDAKGLLYFFDLSIDLYKPIERINPLQNYNNPKHITVNKLDHQYQIKINFFDMNIQEIYINVLKYVEKDFKTIKQKNHDLLKNLMQNNY